MFEPHQPEQCNFKPEVLLDVTPAWEKKRQAMESMEAQRHLVEYLLGPEPPARHAGCP